MAARWKHLELAVFATQLYDRHIVADGRDVSYDEKLANPDGLCLGSRAKPDAVALRPRRAARSEACHARRRSHPRRG